MNEVEREHPLYLNKPWTRQKVRKIFAKFSCPKRLSARDLVRSSTIYRRKPEADAGYGHPGTRQHSNPAARRSKQRSAVTVSRADLKLPTGDGREIMPSCFPIRRRTSLFIKRRR